MTKRTEYNDPYLENREIESIATSLEHPSLRRSFRGADPVGEAYRAARSRSAPPITAAPAGRRHIVFGR